MAACAIFPTVHGCVVFFRWIFLSFIGGFGSVTSASASVFSSFLWLFSCALSKFTVLIMY